jgi:hypothetical protein
MTTTNAPHRGWRALAAMAGGAAAIALLAFFGTSWAGASATNVASAQVQRVQDVDDDSDQDQAQIQQNNAMQSMIQSEQQAEQQNEQANQQALQDELRAQQGDQ